MMIKKRKIIQLVSDTSELKNATHPLVALCDDGTVWQRMGGDWVQLCIEDIEYGDDKAPLDALIDSVTID